MILLRSFFLLFLVLFQISVSASAMDLQGSATITDGDTVIISGQKVRLIGIDAPETDQLCVDSKGKLWTCGIAARDALIWKAGNGMNRTGFAGGLNS